MWWCAMQHGLLLQLHVTFNYMKSIKQRVTQECALLRIFWILASRPPRGKDTRWKLARKKNSWIKQNKCNDKTDLVSYHRAYCNSAQNTMFHCHGNLALSHSPLKTQTKTHVHKPTIVDATTHRFIALHINKLTFVSSSIEFNLFWFSSRQNTHAVLWVPSSQKSLVGRTAFLTEDKTPVLQTESMQCF